MQSLQERYAPNSRCFGCGPKNAKGLRIRSFPKGHDVIADWKSEPHHLAFAHFVNGGILSTLLDCQGNWTAAYALMKKRGLDAPPGTVTAEYNVKFLRPTPVGKAVHVQARAVALEDDRATVEASIEVDGRTTATMRGTFVAVEEDHPAFHRWR